MTNRQIKLIVYVALLLMCAGTTAYIYALGFPRFAVAGAVVYVVEALWIWRRHFGRHLPR